MGLFKKKKETPLVEQKCPECSFTCDDDTTMRKHIGWKHPELKGEK